MHGAAADWVEEDGMNDPHALMPVVLQLVDGLLMSPPVLRGACGIHDGIQCCDGCDAESAMMIL